MNIQKYCLKVIHNIDKNVQTLKLKSTHTELPKNVDLRNKCPTIYNQGNIGSCTANALCFLYDYGDNTEKYKYSRLFLYYNERVLDNDVSDDAGSTITQGINALSKYGVCEEKNWPYTDDSKKFKQKPPAVCYIDGLKHKVVSAEPIKQTLTNLKTCLANGNPFACGIQIYSSFESDLVAQTGIVPMPVKNDDYMGGHAIACVGYDDNKKMFIMRNSWGVGWGEKGYFYLPYAYLTDDNLAGDFWKITKEVNQ